MNKNEDAVVNDVNEVSEAQTENHEQDKTETKMNETQVVSERKTEEIAEIPVNEVSSNKYAKESPKILKVKRDPTDISPEDRKRNVKKLAGAISHSLRANGEISVRSFGNAAIGKAARALAIAKNYISIQNLQLSCSPAFISTKIGDNDLTGISFCAFTSEKASEEEIDPENCENVLMVKADPKDVTPDLRKRNVKKLAGAVAHSLQENKEVLVRCFGNASIGKAAKALAIARGYVATRGPDLYMFPVFIKAEMNGIMRHGIGFFCYTNEF